LLFTNQDLGKVRLKEIGFSFILQKTWPTSEAVPQIDELGGVDIAITTSNTWDDFRLSLQLARKGGQVVCMGFPGRGETAPPFNPLDSQYLYDKQLSIRHCGYTPDLNVDAIDARFTLKRNIQYLATLILNGAFNPLDILTIECPWTDLAVVYQRLASREPGQYSALLAWRK
jgi:threonine dehydrogenase-like Zn-dependent dehydrogenase